MAITRIALFTISLLGTLAAGEILTARLAPQLIFTRLPDAGTGCYQSDPTLFAVPKPGTFCTHTTPEYSLRTPINAQGFVGITDTPVRKSAGVTRIAFIGDSFTFGQGVPYDRAYPMLTGKLLSYHGVSAEILNASMVGAGPHWYYLRLVHSLAAFAPDVVVVGLYAGNDISDMQYFQATANDSSGLPLAVTTAEEYVDTDGVRRATSTLLRYRVPILRNSNLFQLAASKIGGAPFAAPSSAINGSPCLLTLTCPELSTGIDNMATLIRGMRTITDAWGARLIVLLIPWELQLPRHILARSRITFYATDATRHALTDAIEQSLQQHGVTTLNLLPIFEANTSDEMLIYPQDRHWTDAAHVLTATSITKVLRSMITGPGPQAEEP